MRRAIATAIVCLTVIIPAFVVAITIHPPLLGYALIVVGRRPPCSLKSAIAGYRRSLAQGSLQDRAVQDSPIVEIKEGYQHVHSPVGDFWEPQIQGSVVTAQLAELDAKYMDAGDLGVHHGQVVLDCGANVGTFTRYALRHGASRVVAIEPAAANLECLRRNFAPEIADGRVILYPKGVWDKDDTLILYENSKTTAMDSFVRTNDSKPGQRVPLTTIDKLVSELKLERVDFIKMDIEGAEREALAGARKTISAWKPALEISVNHLPDDPTVVPAVIRSMRGDYQIECLTCELDRKHWRTEAIILYFM
jgi:FkbM family methyltransferase